MEYIGLISGVLEGILGIAESATSGQVQHIIGIIDKAIPFVAQLGTEISTPLTNVINALTGNGNVTADQLATLQAQSDAIDAALDAAAKDDGLTG